MTDRPLPPPPRAFKLVAALCLAFTSCTGVFSASEAMNLLRLDEVRAAQFQDSGRTDRPATRAALERHVRQLEGMRESRGVVLSLLAIASAICFVAASRMLARPIFPREGVRRLLVKALIGAAVLRTIDGAQQAAIANQTRGAWAAAIREQVEASDPQLLAAMERMVERLFVPVQVGITFAVVAALVLFLQYFHSERVRTFVVETDELIRG